MIQNTIKSGDVISSKMAEAYVTIGEQRIHAMNLINLEATVEKDKSEVALLGKVMKSHKTIGASGTFSGSIHWMSSRFQRLIEEYKDSGVDTYFTIQGTINDPTSAAGTQTVILYNCNLDSTLLMKFDAEGETLSHDIEGTFDDFAIQDEFKSIDGAL